MDDKKMTQRALALAVGIRQQSVHYLLHATKGTAPRSKYITKMAEVLGVSPMWLETGHGDPKGGNIITSEGRRIGRRIQIKDQASLLNPAQTNLQEMTCDTDAEGAFGYEVPDAAMDPEIRTGDRLVIVPIPPSKARGGTTCLFRVDGVPEVRRLRLFGTGKARRFELVALNPDFPTFTSENNKVELEGVVAEVRRFMPM